LRRTMCALLGAACAVAALAAPAGAAVQVSQSGWFWGNPGPQGNTLRALDFLSGRGYAIGDAGTALRTDDGGATWAGLATGTSADLDRLQVVTPDTLVVQGGDGCVLRRSDDGGRTFRRIYVLAERDCPNRVQAASFVAPQVGTPDQQASALSLQQTITRLLPDTLYREASAAILSPQVASVSTPATLGGYEQLAQRIPSLQSLDQSVLLIWPHVITMLALTAACFAIAYIRFMRQEVRA